MILEKECRKNLSTAKKKYGVVYVCGEHNPDNFTGKIEERCRARYVTEVLHDYVCSSF